MKAIDYYAGQALAALVKKTDMNPSGDNEWAPLAEEAAALALLMAQAVCGTERHDWEDTRGDGPKTWGRSCQRCGRFETPAETCEQQGHTWGVEASASHGLPAGAGAVLTQLCCQCCGELSEDRGGRHG